MVQYGRDTVDNNFLVTPRPSCWEIFVYMRYVSLSNGGSAIVDDEDYERMSRHNWWRNSTGYASREEHGHVIKMHREIMSTPKGMHTDHINMNRLDNRKANLRVCLPCQNIRNQKGHLNKPTKTSQFKGVYFYPHTKTDKKWKTEIQWDKKTWVSSFNSEHLAALAYDFWAVQLHGEYARTNFKVVKWG
jgi:hypothetical protein